MWTSPANATMSPTIELVLRRFLQGCSVISSASICSRTMYGYDREPLYLFGRTPLSRAESLINDIYHLRKIDQPLLLIDLSSDVFGQGNEPALAISWARKVISVAPQ